jgi:F-type H+-transporting ATPase subunit epsilon
MANPSISPAAGGTLHCIVVTPEATVLDTQARFVAIPLFDGEIGIAPLHSPMIGRLGFGEMRVTDHSGTRVFYVDGGFVQVAGDQVAVLTGRAIPAEQVEAEAAAELLEKARQTTARGEERMAIRERHVTQARGQLRVARRRRAK